MLNNSIKIKNFFKFFSIPIIFSIIIVGLLIFLTSKSVANFEIVFGIALGVVLGFIADIIKTAIERWTNHTKLVDESLKLLKEDAKEIYHTLKMYEAISTSPNMPEGTNLVIPFDLEMKYWTKLNERNDFLYLASEKPFDEIFKSFWGVERLQGFIKLARENENNPKHRVASIQACKIFLEDKKHDKLLELLLSKKEIEEFKK